MCRTALNRNAGWALKIKGWLVNLVIGRTAEMGSRAILAGVAAGDESHGKLMADGEIAEYVFPISFSTRSVLEIL